MEGQTSSTPLGWELAARPVSAALSAHVCALVGFERTAEPCVRRQFPGTRVVLILDLDEPMRVSLGLEGAGGNRASAHEGGCVVGLGDRFALTRHPGRQRGVQVDLSPTGARRLFGRPLAELAGRVVALTDLVPEVACLAEQLHDAPSWDAKLALVEDLLTRRILATEVDTTRIDWALTRIQRSGGRVQIAELCRELGHSRKHLVQLFREHVGVPPKLVAQLTRFEGLLEQAMADKRSAWTDLALAHGYSDQSHLVRDVRRFTGLTPRELRTQATSPAG